MDLSRVVLMFVVVAFLLFGWPAKPSEASEDACHRPELLFSYLHVDRYNKSYPFVDYMAVVNPVLNHMLERISGVIDSYADLTMYWAEVCKAVDPEDEIAALKNLADELNHRMHTDESVLKIVKILFGNETGEALMMNPPDPLSYSELDGDCLYGLYEIFAQHCGEFSPGYAMKHGDIFEAMCTLGVKEQDLTEAASQTCKDYVYVPNPPWEKASTV